MIKAGMPIKIGTHTIKNRITFAPTVKFDYTDDSGKANEKLISHYVERAKGGCGLICVEATAVTPGGRFCKTHMGLWSDEQIAGHKEIADGCHLYQAIVIIQLNHTGYMSNPECGPAIGPSEIERNDHRGSYTTIALALGEIKKMQQAYIDAAVRAKKAGYDGVQLHACHGYLINQFMSPLTNKRDDEYGGNTENRARFCSEMISEIRKLCGPDFLISVRASGFENSLSDAIMMAEEYVKAGCNYLQISSGIASLNALPEFPDRKVSDVQSLGVYFHEHFKGRIPVSCVGGLVEPGQIEYLLEKEYTDTVDVARAILADPEFANAVLFHKEYQKCFGCKVCQYGPFTAHICPAAHKAKHRIKLNLVPYPKKVQLSTGVTQKDVRITELKKEMPKKESYHLKITGKEIVIEGDKEGIFYAHQTLRQLHVQFGVGIPCMEIEDEPEFAYRGFMLDSSRHFLPKEDVKKIIDVISFFKINKLHWHLIDDQGFRVEIDEYPKLTEIGARRGRSHFGLVDEYENNSGYFTKEDIREIVAYAGEHMIDVIPEIEIPGHESAMLAAYPEAGCQNKEVQVATCGGIFDNLICAGKEESFSFVTKVLDELVELFPYEMIHIGGDEACKRRWRDCPDCQRKIKELGLADENALQQWFVVRVQKYLKQKGKTVMVWNDSLRGEKLPTDFVIQMWMGDKELIADFVARGGKIIQSSTESFYLDYPYAIWDAHKLLHYKLCPDFLDNKEAVIGVECPLWTERITNINREFYQMLPRLPVMAECGWTVEEARRNDDFEERYAGIGDYLAKQGICGAPRAYWHISEELAETEMKEHNRTVYTPQNIEEFKKQEEMMAQERAIYGDER